MTLSIAYCGRERSVEELSALVTGGYVEENLVVTLSFVISQITKHDPQASGELLDGFTSVTRVDLDRTEMAFPAFYGTVGHTGEEALYWHPPAEVAQAYDRLAEAFRRREPGAALLFDSLLAHLEEWERERLDGDVSEPYEEGLYEPGDYYGYLAVQLEHVAQDMRDIAATGEPAVRLTVVGM